MARARNIKPGVFDNEILGEADPVYTLLFIGLWTLADREGRLEDRPKRIKKHLMAYRDTPEISEALDTLMQMGFIDRYTVDGVAVIQVITFKEHQNPHRNEKASVLPEKPIDKGSQDDSSNVPIKSEQVPSESEALGLIPDTGSLITDSGFLNPDPLITDVSEKATTTKTPGDYLKHLVENHGYDERPLRTKTQNTRQARQWLDDGVTLQELDDAVATSRASLEAQGEKTNPSIGYLAKALASNRKQGPAIKAPAAINTRSGFTPDRYAIDETARQFEVIGGDGS